MSNIKQVTIGVAGHIDHGKTSIVQSLTGKNTDTLNEEIKRGMTINIGFAHLNEHICLIDVPGHENFIKNMIAGVCNIDFAMLVIAADDGIMPQTIEHFEILNLLGIKFGCIVINKVDLVDKEWLDLVENDIKKYFKNTFLDIDNIYKTSIIDNSGIKTLKNNLCKVNVENKYERNVFRMFIDRSFKKVGFGSVVTGTVTSGSIKIGEKVKILPQNKVVKVRGLQSHNHKVKEIICGDRGAINLHSLDKITFERGNHLSQLEFSQLTNSSIVKINILSKSKNKIKNNQRVRFLLGTQEVMARLFIFEEKINSKEIIALMKFERSIIATFKDKFIIRSYSPVNTIGGGFILDVNIFGKWKENKNYAQQLLENHKNDSSIIALIIENNNLKPYTLNSLSKKLILDSKIILKHLEQENIILYDNKDNPWILTSKQQNVFFHIILDFIKSFHKKNKYLRGVTKEQINSLFNIDINLLNHILTSLSSEKKIKFNNDVYYDNDFEIKLDDKDIKMRLNIIEYLNDQKFNTSNIKELSSVFNYNEDRISKLLKMENNNNVIIINGTYIITKLNYEKLLHIIRNFFNNNDSLTVKDFKDITKTTRKYAVPLLEYLDKEKITYRIGNERKQCK